MSNSENRLLELKKELELRNYSAATIRNYSIAVKSFFEFVKTQSKTDIVEIVKDYSLRLKFQKRAPKGINLELAAIRFFCDKVLGITIPVSLVPRHKEPRSLPKIFDREEIAEILKLTINPKHKLLLALCYGCGLRVSEVVSLQVSNFYNDFAMIRITGKGEKDRIAPGEKNENIINSATVGLGNIARWKRY